MKEADKKTRKGKTPTSQQNARNAKKVIKSDPKLAELNAYSDADVALYIGESLTKTVNGTNFYRKYIDKFLDEALKYPDGRCGMKMAELMFSQNVLSKLGKEAQKAKTEQEDYAIYLLRQTLYKEQQEVFDNDFDRKIMVICSRRSGKCFSPDTLLRKFDGSVVRADEVVVGDVLIDDKSRPTIVEALASGEEEMFEVKSNKPSINFKCNASHILTVIKTRKSVGRVDYHGYDEVGKVYDIPLKEFLSMSSCAQSSFALFRARTEYPTQEHYIDPYLLGAWLGAGNRTQPSLTVDARETEEIDELFRIAHASGWKVPSMYPTKSKAVTVFMRSPRRHSFMSEIKRLGIYKNKHIPKEYMIDSSYNRLRLLAGLIDTDGSYPANKGPLEFYNCNKTLVDNVIELAHSLGFHVTVSSKTSVSGNVVYTVSIKGKLSQIPTVIPRKKANDCKQRPYYGFKIRPLGKGKYNGFTLSGNGRCLLSDYTVVHNTELNARKLLKMAIRRNSPCLYLNKTFANAIRQMYDLIMKLAEKLDLAVSKSSKTDGYIEFTNGSSIQFGGINDIAAIDKYRGFKYRLVVVDEVGHIKNGQYLIDEVLTPATADYKDSQMVFTGTPPRVKNFATRLWHSNIRKYHWTAVLNPFIADFQEFIDRVCAEKGLTLDDPYIQREYYGNMDAYDTNAIIWKGFKRYKMNDLSFTRVEIESDIGHLIFHPTSVYIGVDWGGKDQNAIVSVIVDEIGKHALVYDVWNGNECGLEVIKAEIQKAYNNGIKLLHDYGIDDGDKKIRIVTDTNMVEFCVDLSNMGLPVEKAMKYDMMTSVENMGALLRTGKVMVPSEWNDDNLLVYDLLNTVYKRDEETDDLLPEIDDDTYHPDAAHALRYAVRSFTNSGTWLGKKAGNTTPTDKTVIPGLENLKDYGPKGATYLENRSSDEEFVV